MSQQSPDYKRLWLEEQCRRQEAEQAREEEQRRREEAELAQEKAEEKTRKTTLPEFLDACHNHLHSNLAVQTNVSLSTRGGPANANNKLRPERVLIWDDFAAHQEAIWDDLMSLDFVSERHFTSVHTLTESGEAVRRRMLSSELDLNVFQRSTVEDPVSLIIKQMYNDRSLRRKFCLQGSISFENHANTLSTELLEEGMEQTTLSGTQPRRSPRLQAQSKDARPLSSTDPIESTAIRVAARPSRPRADQFCVYNISTQNIENRIAAFIVEYKAPHKLPLSYIYEGLDDMELEDVIQCRETDTPRDHFRRLMAAVITQAFSYIVKVGLKYGCVCTGEAFIFLRVPDDPRTVHYFLSVPKGDVGESTGWVPNSGGANRLHLTAVGQMLAFTLQALKTPPRGQKWRAEAAAQLNSWEVVYDDMLDVIPLQDAPSSEYRPPRHDVFLRTSPIQLRGRPALTGSPNCSRPQDQHEASDDEPDPDTPSRQISSPQCPSGTQATAGSSSPSRNSRRGAQSGQYCTQNCLRGLVEGGPLDMLCPNVRDHGESYHQIDTPTFLDLIRQQLSKTLDIDCNPVGVPGACGVLFRVRLRSHGYTVAAKCTPIDFVHRLKREATIYEHLRPIQGIHVPVHLGNIDLDTPYFYEGITELVHMMFLSFGGKPIYQHLTTKNRQYITQQVDCAVRAIHELRVLHKDLMPRNMLWDEETSQVMVIDFERAQVCEPRPALGIISSNWKRKRGLDSERSLTKQIGDRCSVFTREIRRAAIELHSLKVFE
ncbi:hypothetical protein M501DRAFT_926687 [Patellaria atrata CBS 101060]|uniref:Protein kinase domain-containing protein n=1 Tax=Patellaria atrata CBS 101060 TaxID=1346257 RepID=A0A9P4VS30_9PEZI|nr:hypothetical protein M501DRAFT_926687 [Patellaria atrata CBS 101060]